MSDDQNRDRTSDERFGRRVHEGMNGGVSRNAHVSGGESRLAGEGADAMQEERGAGGYGDDTGFAGGTHGAGAANTGGDKPSGMNTGGSADDAGTSSGANTGGSASGSSSGMLAGQGGTYAEQSGTEAETRTGGVGRQAPSGMDEGSGAS